MGKWETMTRMKGSKWMNHRVTTQMETIVPRVEITITVAFKVMSPGGSYSPVFPFDYFFDPGTNCYEQNSLRKLNREFVKMICMRLVIYEKLSLTQPKKIYYYK
ncbi:hypothetical protein HGM15179_012530 [Zosterops borbonicus]|uniref:Uncharacterized protein n=1 Tax=Zosterops borbonicus TaxID=364589 RepID=A0A8K1GAX9_9PASS|nr:hypothetical protein HGM15179_012530 [Zosterops borbonicus]